MVLDVSGAVRREVMGIVWVAVEGAVLVREQIQSLMVSTRITFELHVDREKYHSSIIS